MQSEVIDDILNIEDRAEKMIAEAERGARDIVFNARAEGKELVERELRELRESHNAELIAATAALENKTAEYENESAKTAEAEIADADLKKVIKRVIELLESAE